MTLLSKKSAELSSASKTGKAETPKRIGLSLEEAMAQRMKDPNYAREHEKAKRMTLDELNEALS